VLSVNDGRDAYTFADILIGQGSSGSDNNWWFGGKNCNGGNGNSVTCTGTDAAGVSWTATFQRGGNADNNVDISGGGLQAV
jgi:hypothetical protein